MKIKAPPRIMIVAAVCALALVGLVVREGAARASGFEVLLPMEAVDPRSLLSGHYVDINLTQRLDESAPCPPGGERSKWLALQAEGEAHVIAGGADSRDEAQQIGPVLVRGAFRCWQIAGGGEGEAVQNAVRLDIGVERFHINQRDALAIERALRQQSEASVFAIVSIGRDGRARLKGLMLDGERLELAWL